MVNYALTQNGLVCHLAQFKTLIRVAVEAIEPGIVREPSARFPHLANLSRNEFTSEWCVSDYLDCIRLSMVPRSEDVIDLASKMHPDGRDGLSSALIIGDILAAVTGRLTCAARRPTLIKCHISQFVVARCIRDGLIAISQSARDPFWIRDGSVDGVLMADGTHHVPRTQRTTAAAAGEVIPSSSTEDTRRAFSYYQPNTVGRCTGWRSFGAARSACSHLMMSISGPS